MTTAPPATSKLLKGKNHWFIRSFLALYALIFCLILLYPPTIDALLEDIRRLVALTSFVGAAPLAVPLLVSLIAPLLCDQLSGEVKAWLVFRRFKNPLPGCRAFTEIGKRDYRVSLTHLEALHGQLPSAPAEQNRLWYRIYKRHEADESVREPHAKYLLWRDLVAVVAFLFVVGSPAVVFAGQRPGAGLLAYLGINIVLYAVLANAAGVAAERLVKNVLALESAAMPA